MKDILYPWLRQITLRQLRGFGAIRRAGSLSGAAKLMHLTPPAISLQLRDLENAIGAPLFDRVEGSLTPTRIGHEVEGLVDEIEALLLRFGENVDALKGVDRGVVSVGVVSTARYFAPTVLANFLKLHPEVRIQLQVGNRDSTIEKLESLELDFVIMGLPPDHFEVEREFISKHPQILIAPPDHPLAERTEIPLLELRGETFLMREPGSGTRAVADSLFARHRNMPQFELEFGSNETIKQAVIAGFGIALISAHTVAAELREKRLIALDVKGLPINRKWYLVKHAGKRLLPSAKALWKFIARDGRRYLPEV